MSWSHGTTYGYKGKSCRCDACRDAAREAHKAARDRARSENRPSYQRDLATSRAAKRRRTGTCALCGGPTTLRRLGGDAADVCRSCAPSHYGPIYSAAKRGKGPMQERFFTLFNGQPLRYSEIRDRLGISSGYASVLLHRSLRHGLVVRVGRGLYALPPESRAREPEAVTPLKEKAS